MTSTDPLGRLQSKRGSNKNSRLHRPPLQKRATMAAAAIRTYRMLSISVATMWDTAKDLRGFTIKVCEGTGEMLIFTGTAKHLPNAEESHPPSATQSMRGLDRSRTISLQSVAVEVNSYKRRPRTRYRLIRGCAGSNTVTDITQRRHEFEISAPALPQVNTKQMSKLYAKVRNTPVSGVWNHLLTFTAESEPSASAWRLRLAWLSESSRCKKCCYRCQSQ